MTGKFRYANVENLEQYIHHTFKGRRPLGFMNDLTPLDRFRDALIMGMRLTKGIDLSIISERYNVNAYEYMQSTIGDLVELDLCEFDQRTARLTHKGILLSNQVFIRWI